MAGLLFWKEMFEVGFERVQRRSLSGRKGKVNPRRGAEDDKGMGTDRSPLRSMAALSSVNGSLQTGDISCCNINVQ